MAFTFSTDVTVSGGKALQTNKLTAPTASGGSTYGVGTNGQVLTSNGSAIYWNENPLTYSLSGNCIYRGKNLGTITSSTINSFVTDHGLSTGEFKDIFVGDYVTISDGTYNKVWTVVGLDMLYNHGPNASTINGHGIELFPRLMNTNYGQKMASSASTTGGYKASAAHTFLSGTFSTNMANALSTHLLTINAYVSNSVSSGVANGGEWIQTKAIIPTDAQIFGATYGGKTRFDAGDGCQQFPAFKFISINRMNRASFWTRSVASASKYTTYSDGGYPGELDANADWVHACPVIRIG